MYSAYNATNLVTSDNISKVGIIVLAAGASTRMGTPKQLLQFRGRSFLRHCVEVAVASVCKPIVVVVGAFAEQMHPEISQLCVVVVENQEWQQGMSASIRVGITALLAICEDIEAVVVVLCDQPFVSSDVINQLVEISRTTDKAIVACEYAGTLGVPALFHRKFFSELMSFKAASGAKQIIKKYPQEVFPLPFAEGAIDIDTPQDYEALDTE
jgi:molybdenum cofactor cytidylyltransferase